MVDHAEIDDLRTHHNRERIHSRREEPDQLLSDDSVAASGAEDCLRVLTRT